jgi:hypothetical protein
VDPVKPIVYYIDPATPEKWRPYLKQGIEDWQVAFEAAGFSNAILAKDPPSPEEDPDFSLGEVEIISYGAQLEYSFARFGLELEPVFGTVDATGADVLFRGGFSAMISYRLFDGVTPYFRFEYLDPDYDTDDDLATMYIYGCNFMLDQGLFVKAEIDTIQSEPNNKNFEGVDYSEVKGAVAISF